MTTNNGPNNSSSVPNLFYWGHPCNVYRLHNIWQMTDNKITIYESDDSFFYYDEVDNEWVFYNPDPEKD